MDTGLKKAIGRLVDGSECARELAPLKARGAGERLFGAATRSLTKKEIDALSASGNVCAAWD